MKPPRATRADHERFCAREGWTRVRNARGRTGTHHVIYELTLPDGRVLRTRISHPPDRSTYGPSLWAHILRDQLQVSEDDFWACVDRKVLPDRGFPVRSSSESLPAELVRLLVHRAGVPEAEIRTMTKDEAITRLNAYWNGL
ncbi:hypothetical protein GCM10027271_57230 [Saccharopolyspora gloriosae]|uniref:Cytotoxic translational repressor of toxin-antitoxin stability system n=1 Tax=Saccharopolyspora gloriosae TaxID=455344 RepID=A0A840NHS0_9PSEU|nr:hypothetical protein [Saccharopolyspora gloriosae]